MSVTNEAASEPSGESMEASTMALSMRPRKHLRHRGADEEREDLVGTRQRPPRVLRVVGEEAGADAEVDGQGHERAERREGERALALAARLDGEEALHQVVVGAEGRHRAHEPVEHGEPDDVGIGEHARARSRASPGAGPQLIDGQAPRLGRGRVHGGEPAVDLRGEEEPRCRARPRGRALGLEHIGPHHRLHAAERDVDDGHER